jgi:hypothetical protein
MDYRRFRTGCFATRFVFVIDRLIGSIKSPGVNQRSFCERGLWVKRPRSAVLVVVGLFKIPEGITVY